MSTTEESALLPFYITFGTKYAKEPHPVIKGLHPDHWVTIYAPDKDAARQCAWLVFGDYWAFSYSAAEFMPEYHRAGELFSLVCSDPQIPESLRQS